MQLVTITDTIAPVITAPVGVTANSINGADVTVALGTATASDLFTVTISSNAPVNFPVGITTVTWTATDTNGNTSTATQLVTVSLVDTLPPVITVPANVSVSTNTSQATVDIGIASANDNIDGVVAVTNNAPATFPVGVTSIIYTASDNTGNTATATQQIYVSFSSTVGGGTGGGTTTPPAQGGGATVGIEAVYWHHNDHLGTPQAMTDISGTKVWEMSQTPFGIVTVNNDPDGDGFTVTNNFRFPGQYFDAETGHHYNYFRTYDPNTGYTQHDPIGLNGGLNTFAYVGGNPINLFDPSGLDAIYINYDYYPVTTPIGKFPLGHGAVVAVDPVNGNTKYYEFGRYGNPDGVVRGSPEIKIPNVVIGKNNLPTQTSLNQLYNFLSKNFGHGVEISATYYPDSDYQGTINFAEKFRRKHPDYDLWSNNCKTFGKTAATACQEGAICQ